MSGHANAYGAYRSAEITTASQKDLIVRLYLGAEKFLDLACQAMAAKKYVDSMTNCRKARDIFMELMSTLNFEQGGELAIRLKDLYAFLVFQISEAPSPVVQVCRRNPDSIHWERPQRPALFRLKLRNQIVPTRAKGSGQFFGNAEMLVVGVLRQRRVRKSGRHDHCGDAQPCTPLFH